MCVCVCKEACTQVLQTIRNIVREVEISSTSKTVCQPLWTKDVCVCVWGGMHSSITNHQQYCEGGWNFFHQWNSISTLVNQGVCVCGGGGEGGIKTPVYSLKKIPRTSHLGCRAITFMSNIWKSTFGWVLFSQQFLYPNEWHLNLPGSEVSNLYYKDTSKT